MSAHVKFKGYIIHGKKPLLTLDLVPGSASHEETYYLVLMTPSPPPPLSSNLSCLLNNSQSEEDCSPFKLYIFWHFKSHQTPLPLPDKKINGH